MRAMFVLEQLKKHAQAEEIALLGSRDSLSFAQLDARSDAFAHWLFERFGSDKSPLLIYGQKELDFLPCAFGALKSGRAYLPVDSILPPSRLAEILSNLTPCAVVDFTGTLSLPGHLVLDGDALLPILSSPLRAEFPRQNWVCGEDIAYILFTSGSTGRPKGVPITADNLAAFYGGLLPFMGEAGGVILDQVSYSFDVSGCSVYGGLSRGMTLLPVDRALSEDVGGLLDFLRASRLGFWVSTPSLAEICVRSKAFTQALLPELHTFLFCGEVLTNALCDRLSERFPHARILNTYGPTEATVLVTACTVTPEMRADSRPIPIGRPIEGVRLLLTDEDGKEITADGERGELLILGRSVGPGYLGRPELSAARFFTHPATGLRGYRTGDICTRAGDLYYYHMRRDNQLKLHGHRVELEDVEANLARIPNIAGAAVLPVWEDGRAQHLVAFILLKKADGLAPLGRAIAIKKAAAALLPAYMIPRKFILLDAFPLNTSGKVDRKALQARLDDAK